MILHDLEELGMDGVDSAIVKYNSKVQEKITNSEKFNILIELGFDIYSNVNYQAIGGKTYYFFDGKRFNKVDFSKDLDFEILCKDLING